MKRSTVNGGDTVAVEMPADGIPGEVGGEVAAVLTAFGVGRPSRVIPVAEGLMNPNWRVETDAGVFAVKQVRDVTVDRVAFQHRVTAALGRQGLPVPAPLVTRSGDTLVNAGGRVYACYRWVGGTHRRGGDLATDECVGLGELLARLHVALCRVAPATSASRREPVTETATAKAKIDRYLGWVGAHDGWDDFDRIAATRLAERRELLERYAWLRPDETAEVSPIGWVHGDFHDLNLLWQAGRVTAVLDWDRLKVWTPASELVRTATLLFSYGDDQGLDLERVSAFTAGYRLVAGLTDRQVRDAVHRLWWERLCDLWQLKWHYDRGDTSCDHLFVSASALLSWWCDHREDVVHAFTTSTPSG